jgi:hypothetical protein
MEKMNIASKPRRAQDLLLSKKQLTKMEEIKTAGKPANTEKGPNGIRELTIPIPRMPKNLVNLFLLNIFLTTKYIRNTKDKNRV